MSGVHFCFNGIEIQNRLIGHLNHAFYQIGIKTTFDGHPHTRGEEVSQSTLKAIENSRCSIVVFCCNFAFSPRCLDELNKIIDCEKQNGQLVCPLFFQIDQSEVANLKGSYGEAIAGHREKFKNEMMKIERWMVNLHDAANFEGWTFKTGCESTFIQTIVKAITGKIMCNGLQTHITERETLLDLGSCGDVDTVGKNGIELIGAKCNARDKKSPSVPQLKPFFTSSFRKESISIEARACCKQTWAEKNGLKFFDTRAKEVLVPRVEDNLVSRELNRNHSHLALNNASMESTFASLIAESTILSVSQDTGTVNMRPSEEMKSAMQTLQTYVSKEFSELVPQESKFKEYIQKNMLSFSAEKISPRMGSMVETLLFYFTHWSRYYQDADTKLKKITADLSEDAELEQNFEAAVKESKKAVYAEKEVCIQLEYMQCKRKRLEEQLKAVTGEIHDLSSSCQTAATRKRSLLDQGLKLQTEKAKLMVQLPCLMAEQAAAKSTQENIESEWLKLGEVFNKFFMSEFEST